jgi:PAS domain S-box-containing protein
MASARTSLIESSSVGQPARMERSLLLETIFDQFPDAKLLCDRDLQIVGVNRAAERLFGKAAQEIIGENCQELLYRSSEDASLALLPADRGPTCLPSGTARLRLKSGGTRVVAIATVAVYDDSNAIRGVVTTINYLTNEARPAERPIIAESRAMLDLLGFVRKVAASEATSVLLQGENGTGKDLIAEALHYQSPRQTRPFLAINCAAIPANLLESELFGYEKGAFTDARAQKRGLFELADKGTLFLDEIGEMPSVLQAKLLRALEDQTFRRLGGLRDIHVDVRFIAASNTNLSQAIQEGRFRRDLYYRLNVIQLVVPALRERLEDVLPLARFFIQQYNARFQRHIDGISPEAERLMLAYHWPGNVRELRNAIERAMIFEDTAWILPASLHIGVPCEAALAALAWAQSDLPLSGGKSALLELERSMVIQALEAATGNQSQAARSLCISRDVLRYKMKKFNLCGTPQSPSLYKNEQF